MGAYFKYKILPRVLGKQFANIVRIVSSLILDPTSSITVSTVSLMKSRSSTLGLPSGTSDCPAFTPTSIDFCIVKIMFSFHFVIRRDPLKSLAKEVKKKIQK